MLEYSNLGTEVGEIKNYVLLNMFGLVCENLNTEMYNRYTREFVQIYRKCTTVQELVCTLYTNR